MDRLTVAKFELIMETMEKWVMGAYPNEGCGLIVERNGSPEAICCENMQDKLHEIDPKRYPRTAATAYNVNPMLVYELQEAQVPIRAVFHSHPDRGAYFSDEDVLAALGGDPDGSPVLPGVDYLVLSTRRDGVADAKLFTWDDQSQTFVEQVNA